MAFNGLKVINSRLDNRIAYILNPKKTSNGLYTGGVNTMPPCAYADMQATKRRYDKQGGRLGYHLIQSFAPGEITPQEAMKIGREFINRYLHGHYEVVYAVHTDHEHTHLHIIWNSVSFIDGIKYHAPPGAYLDEIRRVSDAICHERGYSIIREGEKANGQHYASWKAEQAGQFTLRNQIRHDMDIAIRASMTWTAFLREMERMGYRFKVNYKHPAVKAPGHPRYVRLKSLGEKYMPDGIKQRILRQQRPERPPKVEPIKKRRVVFRGKFKLSKVTWKSIRALYYYYLSRIKQIEKKLDQRYELKSAVMQLQLDVARRHELYARFQFLNAHNIDTPEQLRAHEKKVQGEIQPLVKQREILYYKRRRAKTPDEVEKYSKEIISLNAKLLTCRKENRLCKAILADAPAMRKTVRQLLHIQPKQREEKHREKHQDWVR